MFASNLQQFATLLLVVPPLFVCVGHVIFRLRFAFVNIQY